MQQNKEQQSKKSSPPPEASDSKNDLKTPSFIPMLDQPKSQQPSSPLKENKNNGDSSNNIEPDSLDPNINNVEQENNNTAAAAAEEDPKSESSASVATASTSAAAASASTGASNNNGSKKPRSRHRQKRYTHSEKRYHSEVRQEAVQQALAQMNKSKPVPMPSKRSSVMNKPNADDSDESSASGSEEDEQEEEAAAAVADRVNHSEAQNVTNVTLGMSDTSSNNSLARNVVAAIPLETPPSLPLRTVSQTPPNRPPVITSPSRQNSR